MDVQVLAWENAQKSYLQQNTRDQGMYNVLFNADT